MLSVSVVIPVRNAARTLPHCLEALEGLDPQPMEVILVDNGSTDETPEFLRTFAQDHASRGVKIVQEPRAGVSRARNAGIRVARGDILAWTDSDCAPQPSWLRYLVEPFDEPTVGATAGRVLAASPSSIVELFCGLYTFQTPNSPNRAHQWTPRRGGYAGANFAVRRVLAEKLGGYDEEVKNWGEDYDFCARLYAHGFSIAYVPAAQVFHYNRATVRGMLHQAYGQGRSHPYLLRRHAARGLWIDLPCFPVSWRSCPLPLWVDLASADKKVGGILALGTVSAPALWLLPLYLAWLVLLNYRKPRIGAVRISPLTAMGLAGLLLLKSGAMTAGRWRGSLKYGALCF